MKGIPAGKTPMGLEMEIIQKQSGFVMVRCPKCKKGGLMCTGKPVLIRTGKNSLMEHKCEKCGHLQGIEGRFPLDTVCTPSLMDPPAPPKTRGVTDDTN